MSTIAKDKTFAASLAVVTVALFASQGIEIDEPTVQTAVETVLAAVAGIAGLVAAFRAAVIKVSQSALNTAIREGVAGSHGLRPKALPCKREHVDDQPELEPEAPAPDTFDYTGGDK